jgi:hypothetical protein
MQQKYQSAAEASTRPASAAAMASIFSSKDEPEAGSEAIRRWVSFRVGFRLLGADQREAREATNAIRFSFIRRFSFLLFVLWG